MDVATYDSVQAELAKAIEEKALALTAHQDAQNAYDVANERVIALQITLDTLGKLPEIKTVLDARTAQAIPADPSALGQAQEL